MLRAVYNGDRVVLGRWHSFGCAQAGCVPAGKGESRLQRAMHQAQHGQPCAVGTDIIYYYYYNTRVYVYIIMREIHVRRVLLYYSIDDDNCASYLIFSASDTFHTRTRNFFPFSANVFANTFVIDDFFVKLITAITSWIGGNWTIEIGDSDLFYVCDRHTAMSSTSRFVFIQKTHLSSTKNRILFVIYSTRQILFHSVKIESGDSLKTAYLCWLNVLRASRHFENSKQLNS